MYAIEKAPFGYRMNFKEIILRDEMAQWVQDSEFILNGVPRGFGLYLDMRKLKPLADDAQLELAKGQKVYQGAGVQRSVAIVATPEVAAQLRELAKASGLDANERYIDVSFPSFERLALEWLNDGIDPDPKMRAA